MQQRKSGFPSSTGFYEI